MASVSKIKPFAFERVFSQAAASDAGKPDPAILQGEVETLRAQLERVELEKEMALVVARNEGFQAGLAQARAEREAAMLAAIDALQAGIEQIAEEVDEAVTRATAEAAELALAAADYLAGRAIAAAPAETIDAALGRVLDQLGRNPRLQVKVHPTLVEEMERLIAARQAADRRRMHVHVAADETMPIGDTHISWDEGGLRLDFESRRDAVREELEGILG